MSFNEIEGHDLPLQILLRAIAHETLGHAYLFSGRDGIGKKKAALGLAAAVICGAPGVNGGCGICSSCRRVASGAHPDVHLLAAEGDEIKIDQIREIQSALSLRPFEGSKKVLIVDGADGLNTASSNAFLKTLEEPPGDSLIILISSMPQSLLPTIRSRCQEIVFHPLPRHTLAAVLQRKRGLSEDDAWFLAALAQGSMGRGLEMDVDAERSLRDEALSLWAGLGNLSAGTVLQQAEGYGKDREQLERFLDTGIEWLRDVVVYGETGDERLLVNGGRRDLLRRWCEQRPLPRTFLDMELLIASRNLLGRRVSAPLVAENLFLKLSRA